MDFDSRDGTDHRSPGLRKIETQEDARDRRQKAVPVRIDLDICDSTGACVLVCPEDVIDSRNGISTVVSPEACTECWLCVENCPSAAVEMT